MKASELIEELQKRIEIYGDFPIVIRLSGEDEDIEFFVVYGDDEDERIVISDDYFL